MPVQRQANFSPGWCTPGHVEKKCQRTLPTISTAAVVAAIFAAQVKDEHVGVVKDSPRNSIFLSNGTCPPTWETELRLRTGCWLIYKDENPGVSVDAYFPILRI